MAAQVGPLPQIRLPEAPSPITAEQRYWKSFKDKVLVPSPTNYAITHVTYNPPAESVEATASAADVFAVTTGTRVQIFSARNRKLVKTLARFSEVARSGHVRQDGRLAVAGDDSGLVQVFDLSSRAILRTWTAHRPQPVWAVRWSPRNNTTLVSAGDDKTVRLWDLPSNEPVTTFHGHGDYVRCTAFVPGSAGAVVSGSYDSTVRLWDPRVGSSVMIFKHAAPVDDVLAMPSGSTVVATAGSSISVLDLVAAKPIRIMKNHQKTVTSLSLASGGQRVVSGGLDGHVKVFESTGWNVVYSHKYQSPVLSVGVIGGPGGRADRHLVVGMQSGLLSIRTRLSGAAAAREKEREREMSALVAGKGDTLDQRKEKRKRRADASRNLDMVGEGADVVIANEIGRRKKERGWERDLRHGRYAAALDHVLDTKAADYHPLNALALLMALRHRSAMREALEGRDEAGVLPVVRWVSSRIMDPRYLGLCVEVSLHLLEQYAEFATGSAELNEAFRTLHRRVKVEVEKAQVACQTGGMLESLFVAG